MTADEYARKHQLHHDTVLIALRKGEITGYKVNGAWRLDGDPPWHRDVAAGLTVGQYSRKYGIRDKRVREACVSGKLKAFKVKGRRTGWCIPDEPWPLGTRNRSMAFAAGARCAQTPNERLAMRLVAMMLPHWRKGSEIDMTELRAAYQLANESYDTSNDILTATLPAHMDVYSRPLGA